MDVLLVATTCDDVCSSVPDRPTRLRNTSVSANFGRRELVAALRQPDALQDAVKDPSPSIIEPDHGIKDLAPMPAENLDVKTL
jgi:hypothetical protein